MKQNQNGESGRSHDEYKAMPKVFKKSDPFFAFYKKPKSNSHADSHNNTQVNVSQKKFPHQEQQTNKPAQQDKPPKQKAKSSHSKKNPINPIKQSIKLLDQFGKNINQDYSAFINFTKSLNQHRNKQPKQPQIKLDQCLTLKVIKKLSNGGCIRKVLNVPTFKIYLLEERPIGINDSKHAIQKELEKWNSCPQNSYQLKNVKLYWNTPQEFVSLLHEYTPNYSLQSILTITNSLSEQALAEKMVEIIHMISLFQKQGIKFPKLSSQEILISINNGGIKVRPSIITGAEQSKLQNSMTYQIAKWIEPDNQKMRLPLRIGLLALYLALGGFIMQQQVGQKIFQLYDSQTTLNSNKQGCCLIHLLSTFPSLLLYPLLKRKWSPNLQDFLCRCLSFDRKRRLDLQQIKKHSFITRVDEIERVSFQDLLQVVKKENKIELTTEVEIAYRLQLGRVLEGIRMVLGNKEVKHQVGLPIREDDQVLGWMQEEIGLEREAVRERIGKVYSDFK